jgi:hypothetical protein
MKAKLDTIDSAVSKLTLGYDMLLKRAVPSHLFWKQFGFSGSQPSPNQLQSFVGKTYTEVCHVSTSVLPTWNHTIAGAPEGKVVMTIKANKNVRGVKIYGGSIGGSSSEMEVLLPRGTTFLIRSIKLSPQTYGGKPVWEMEVDIVDQAPQVIQ